MVNEQSIVANKKANLVKMKDQNIILNYLEEYGTATVKELARYMNKGLNQISGRLSELKGHPWYLIEDTGERREGCTVYRLTKNQLRLSI